MKRGGAQSGMGKIKNITEHKHQYSLVVAEKIEFNSQNEHQIYLTCLLCFVQYC